MNITFVSANRETLPDPVIPLGLLHVAAATPTQHRQHWVDLCFADDPLQTLASELSEAEPDLVAVSLRNLQNQDYTGISANIDDYCDVMDTVRSVTDAPVVVGGAGFSVLPQELMRRLLPDFGVVGEGELAFAALTEALATQEGFESIPGLMWWDSGALVTNPRSLRELNQCPPPDRSRLDPRYAELTGITSLQTKRGCPLRCTYCTYPMIEGRSSRVRDPVRVVRDFEAAVNAHPGVNHVFIVDSTFNLPRSHAMAVCNALIESGNAVPWTCYLNPRGFDDELASAMKRAGCVGFEIGSDAGTDRTLKLLRKGFTTADLRRVHQICERNGLLDGHTFVLGTDGETLDDIDQALAFIDELDPFAAIIMMWTDDQELADPDLAQQRAVYRSRVAERVRVAVAGRRNRVVPQLHIAFDKQLFSRLRRVGLDGPLWQHIDRARRARVLAGMWEARHVASIASADRPIFG